MTINNLKLKTPVTFGGKIYKELNLDFAKPAPGEWVNGITVAFVSSAASVPAGVIEALSVADLEQVANNFVDYQKTVPVIAEDLARRVNNILHPINADQGKVAATTNPSAADIIVAAANRISGGK